MLKTNNNDISLTKGDTAAFNIVIKNALGEVYGLSESDKLKLTVRGRPGGSLEVIKKVSVGSSVIRIEPSDTKKILPGKYVYDVELETSWGDVYTIIGPSVFELVPEITE